VGRQRRDGVGLHVGLWRAGMCWIPVGARNPRPRTTSSSTGSSATCCSSRRSSRPWSPACVRRCRSVKAWICIDGEAPEVTGSRSLQRGSRTADDASVRAVELDDVVVLSATGGTTVRRKGDEHHSQHADVLRALHDRLPVPGRRPPVNLARPRSPYGRLLSLPCTARGGTVGVLTKPILRCCWQRSETSGDGVLPAPTVIYRLLDIRT